MKFLRKLFGSKESAASSVGEQMHPAHHAIQEARAGRLPVQEMLNRVVSSTVFVPLSDPPKMDGQKVKSWKPATVSKADGSQWLLAFTSSQLASTFAKHNPTYSHGLNVDTKWILDVMPSAHGLVFNIGSGAMFEWNAAGLAKYKHDVLGMRAS